MIGTAITHHGVGLGPVSGGDGGSGGADGEGVAAWTSSASAAAS